MVNQTLDEEDLKKLMLLSKYQSVKEPLEIQQSRWNT